MLYVSPESSCCVKDSFEQEVTILDTENAEFSAKFVCTADIIDELSAAGIMPQNVAGFYKSGRTFYISPINSVELSVFGLLEHPYFFTSDKLGSSGSEVVKSYGLYNMCLATSMFDEDTMPMSIAKLLLETCGTDYKRGEWRIDTTREYIAICVANEKFQSVYLRYNIKDYNKLLRLYTKYSVLKFGLAKFEVCRVTVNSDRF